MSREFTVNGEPRRVTSSPDTPLLNVLRDELGLTGSRFGCGTGSCGACVVRLDGEPVPSCDTPLWSAERREVVTVEGLGDGLHPVQQAFLDGQAAQCGYCVAGMLVTAATLIDKSAGELDAQAVRKALDRHLCRCGVHQRMIAAVLEAARS